MTLKASDGSAAQSWKSGAYALALQGNGAVKLTAQLGDRSFSKDFTAGGENVKFDWNVPAEASLELADKLLSQVEGIANKNSSTYTNAVLELYQGTKSLSVDEERRKRIEELTKELGPKLEASREAVRAALRNYSQDFNRVLLEHQKPFQGTGVEAWFKEAGTVGQAKGGFEGFKKQVEGNANLPEQQKRQYLNYLVELQKQLKETEFQAQVSALVDAAIPLADPKRAHLYKR
ncbi:MAG: hypothetical protein M5U26_12165 [Planctomycetota bacterium]|nr:hypothetical protein [Planctomycetota bacterium]